MCQNHLYTRDTKPFGKSWEEWAATWCKWMLSIPKSVNPSLDETGRYCSIGQSQENVWFLAGTFGNVVVVDRKCSIPSGKAIFLPILVKEDSFKEDSDLETRSDLIQRCRTATDKLISIQARINGQELSNLTNYRARSEVFDLTFPEGNVYDVRPGQTHSACDGYWLFIKPLEVGKHRLWFKGETLLENAFTLNQLLTNNVHFSIHKHIHENQTFRLEVSYELTIRGHR